MECGDIWLDAMLQHVTDFFRLVTTEDAAVGVLQTIQCELNGEPAVGLLLQIQRDTLRGYDITETGLTLDTILTAKQLPRELGNLLLMEAEARRAAGAPWPEGGPRLDCHIRVDFVDICSVIFIDPSTLPVWGPTMLYIPNRDGEATTAQWARAYAAWQARWNRPSASRRARRSEADGTP